MTQVIPKSSQIVPKILHSLKLGELVIIHTDIYYILVADALNPQAVNKIHQIKKWHPYQPLTLLTNYQKVESWGVLSQDSTVLIKQFPYPISLIIPHRGNLSDEVTAGYKTIFVACPDDFIYHLVEQSSFPLVCTTAGLGADYKATKAETALTLFGEQVSLIVDGGKCQHKMKTTLIDCSLPIPTIMNFGVISFDDLRPILPKIELPSHLRK